MLNGIQSNPGIFKNQLIEQKKPISSFLGSSNPDRAEFSKPQNNFYFREKGKVINIVTFKGLQSPVIAEEPAIQMRVRGVKAHQVSLSDPDFKPKDININKLANSNWKDGQPLDFEILKKKIEGIEVTEIQLSDRKYGVLGRVPEEIAQIIAPVIAKDPKNFSFELSNMVAGTTKGAETIGLRVNLKYKGSNKELAQETFNTVLNNPDCRELVLLYQEPTSPEQVLKRILNHAEKVDGPDSRKKMENAFNNILKVFENSDNEKLLFVGHCKPDGDDLGAELAMMNAIKLSDSCKVNDLVMQAKKSTKSQELKQVLTDIVNQKNPDKVTETLNKARSLADSNEIKIMLDKAIKFSGRKIDCAIDDRIPGLFRHKLPGIDGEIKHPDNPKHIETITKEIAALQAKPQDQKTKSEIKILEQELKFMKDPNNLLNPNAKYDAVVLFDVPTPERFTDKFKQYFDNAKKVIYIDHHPHRINEWNNKAEWTGLDMEKVHKNQLALIADAVPAATQLVSLLASKLLPQLNDIDKNKVSVSQIFKPKQLDMLKAFVASAVTGASTDTGSFSRTANLLPEDMKVPVQERPNFMPEGLSKWLMDLTKIMGNKWRVDKKWLREEISYDITEKKTKDLNDSARDLMLKYSIAGKKVNPELSLGIVEADYDKMSQVWRNAVEVEPETTLLDVQNAFKYSELMGTLRGDPLKHGFDKDKKDEEGLKEPTLHDLAKEDYEGAYDRDRIAVLICQDKQAGELNEKLETANQNGLRLSLRSQEGTIWAELLANLFGGGGHGGASGGRVDLPNVKMDSKLLVKVDGKIEENPANIFKELLNNYEIMRDNKKNNEQKKAECKKFEIVMDPKGENSTNGKTCAELIESLVKQIRAKQDAENKLQSNNLSEQDENNMFLKEFGAYSFKKAS